MEEMIGMKFGRLTVVDTPKVAVVISGKIAQK